MSISNESVLQKSSTQSARSGMALVIVLGLIALLVISSITFAIMMRIERASSANARNTTMARQTAKSALAYAIAAIDQNIGTNRYPHWDKDGTHYNNEQIDRENLVWRCPTQPRLPLDSGGYDQSNARTNYFWKDTFGSADHKLVKGQESRRAPARLFTDQMARYLSKGIRHRAYAQYYSTPDSLTRKYPEETRDRIAPEWVPMTGGTNIINMNNVIGRYAFMAFNTSGYLDIPAICADGPDKRRGFGASASEIVPVSRLFARQSGNSGSFRIGNDPVKKLKEINNGRNFGTIAEILALNNNGNDSNGSLREYFADGAAYSAFNFSAPDRIPTNVVSASDYNDFFANGKFPFKNKICIGGDGGEKHIESLMRHKAAIMAGFWMSGLTASCKEFIEARKGPIKDSKCTDPNCTVCGGKADSFELSEDKFSEQALWAFLGLVDYVDNDDSAFPAEEDISDITFKNYQSDEIDDILRFARPMAEVGPSFNGFMAAARLTREELFETKTFTFYKDDGTPYEEPREFFCSNKVAYAVEFSGKVAFSYQAQNDGFMFLPDDNVGYERDIDAKLGFGFDDTLNGKGISIWDDFAEKLSDSVFAKHDSDAAIFKTAEDNFAASPILSFNMDKVTITNEFEEGIANPNDSDEKNEKMPEVPKCFYVFAAGQTWDSNGRRSGGDNIMRRVPAIKSLYDTTAMTDLSWLTSTYSFSKEGQEKTFEKAIDQKVGYRKVYKSVEDAATQGNNPTYELIKKEVVIVLWAEMLDPRFSCLDSAEYVSDNTFSVMTTISSHIESDEGAGSLAEISTARLNDIDTSYYEELMNQDNIENFDDDFFNEFKNAESYFFGDDEYFTPDENRDGFHTKLQYTLLTDKDFFNNYFQAATDGASYKHDGYKLDKFDEHYHNAYSRNEGLDTAGELGWLPIGPYATIRLCGFDEECEKFKFNEDEKDGLLRYNALPSERPFHNVLDFFTGRRKPVRGLININSTDQIALASVFNEMDVSIDDNITTVDETTAESLGRLLAKTWHHVDPDTPVLDNPADDIKLRGRTSMLGWMFDCFDRNKDEFENYEKKAITGFFTTNARREAAIRNSCGLFSTRGVNLSIIVRGEAFTPFFGRSDVRNDLGTTLASRAAYAQIWRDTEPDDDGNYPYFVQFFKIFDE